VVKIEDADRIVVHTDGPHFQHWRDSGDLISIELDIELETDAVYTLDITAWNSDAESLG
jgi:hypothetical protein